MLALAVVKKAANMSSIADSWERKEGDKFECHFKLVVIQTVLTFCKFCPCAGPWPHLCYPKTCTHPRLAGAKTRHICFSISVRTGHPLAK